MAVSVVFTSFAYTKCGQVSSHLIAPEEGANHFLNCVLSKVRKVPTTFGMTFTPAAETLGTGQRAKFP
jgi:hypothetical protein